MITLELSENLQQIVSLGKRIDQALLKWLRRVRKGLRPANDAGEIVGKTARKNIDSRKGPIEDVQEMR